MKKRESYFGIGPKSFFSPFLMFDAFVEPHSEEEEKDGKGRKLIDCFLLIKLQPKRRMSGWMDG